MVALLLVVPVFAWPYGWNHAFDVFLEYEGQEVTNYTLELDLGKLELEECEGFLEIDGAVWFENCSEGKVWVKLPVLDRSMNFTVYFRRGDGGGPEEVFYFYEGFEEEEVYACTECYTGKNNKWLLNASSLSWATHKNGSLILECNNAHCTYTTPLKISRPFDIEIKGRVNISDNCGSSDYDLIYMVGDESLALKQVINSYDFHPAHDNTTVWFVKRNESGGFNLVSDEQGVFREIEMVARSSLREGDIVFLGEGTYNFRYEVNETDFQNFSRVGFASHDGKQTIDYLRVWKTANATVKVGELMVVNETREVANATKMPVSWWISEGGRWNGSWWMGWRVMNFSTPAEPEELGFYEEGGRWNAEWEVWDGWANFSGVNETCRFYRSEDAWAEGVNETWVGMDKSNSSRIRFAGGAHDFSKQHVVGWVNGESGWESFGGSGKLNGSLVWVEYRGNASEFAVCLASGKEVFYSPPPPAPSASGGSGGSWSVASSIPPKVNEGNESQEVFWGKSEVEPVNISGLVDYVVVGALWVDDGKLEVDGVGQFWLENGYVLTDGAGGEWEGEAEVRTGTYRLELKTASGERSEWNGTVVEDKGQIEEGSGGFMEVLPVALGLGLVGLFGLLGIWFLILKAR